MNNTDFTKGDLRAIKYALELAGEITVLENFMDFYADVKEKTSVRNMKTFMRVIWWDFLDSDVRTASDFSDLRFRWKSNNRNSNDDFLNLL